MGRAERRKREREDRIYENRQAIKMTKEEYKNVQDQVAKDASIFAVEALMTCFATVLHEEYEFGFTRIGRAIGSVDEMFGKVLDGKLSISEMKEKLEKTTGISIKYSGE